MKKLFFDIETIPAGKEQLSIVKALHTKYGGTALFEEYFNKTSFNGGLGRIVCIAYAIDDGPLECLSGDERDVLTKFWQLAREIDLFVGHNIMGFDLKFLYQRSWALKIKPSKDLSFARYRKEPIFDTMHEWNKWDTRENVKLDYLAHIFGIPSSKGELEGSKVWEYYQAGKIDEICEYCMKDVEVNREVYKRMVFESELEPQPAAVVAEETEEGPF